MNNIENDKFQRELGDKLGRFREEPPEGMFERIEQTLLAGGLAGGAESPAEEPAKVIIPLWRRPLFRGVVASLAAASVCLAVILLGGRKELQELGVEQVATSQRVENTGVEAVVEPAEEIAVAEGQEAEVKAVPASVVTSKPTLMAVAERQTGQVLAVSAVEQGGLDGQMAVGHEEQSASSEQGEVTEPRSASEQKAPQGQTATRKSRSSRERLADAVGSRKNSNRRSDSELEEYWRGVLGEQEESRGGLKPLQVGIYTANLGFNRGDVQMDNVSNSQMLVKEQTELGGGSFLGPMMAQKEKVATLEHSMPVSVGVTVNYSLTDWLSLESGLLYTSYSSRGESAGMMSSYVRKRSMDYLGVPLNVRFDVVEYNGLTLYGSLGFTAELCVAAKDRLLLDGALNSVTTLTDFDRLTGSLNAVAGVNYNLFDNIGLFGEVGCSYWSVPDSYPENYRTIHPLSLATRLGLSYSFN